MSASPNKGPGLHETLGPTVFGPIFIAGTSCAVGLYRIPRTTATMQRDMRKSERMTTMPCNVARLVVLVKGERVVAEILVRLLKTVQMQGGLL